MRPLPLLIAGLVFGSAGAVAAAPAKPKVIKATFDVSAPGVPISPLVFGINFAKDAHRDRARIPLERWGGNRLTRFDWKTGNDAAGHDWFWMNGGPNAASPDAVWMNAALARNRTLGIETIVTVPTIGWVAKDNSSCSFPKSKYPNQEKFDPHNLRCGNGRIAAGFDANGATVWKDLTADPAEAGKPVGLEYMAEWVRHIRTKVGPAGEGARIHYALDNEPNLWNSTHRDVHPAPVGYDEAWDRTVKYAAAIKQADPTAWVWGPVEWGWLGIRNSALDGAGPGGYGAAADSKAHQSDFFLRWYIRKLAEHRKATGQLLVDVIDIHDYPEVYVEGAGRITLGGRDDSPATRRARLLAVRTWWDPTYKPSGGEQGTTWIDQPMYLLRRVQRMIREELPELKLAVTEWNFGGNGTINGVLTHALIFRAMMAEGVHAGAEWGTPDANEPAFQAYVLFRNYDGQGSSFTGEFFDIASSDDLVSMFAALDRTAGILRTVVVNADPDRPRRVELTTGRKLVKKSLRTFAVTSAAPTAITAGQPVKASARSVTVDIPAYSVMLVEAGLANP